MFPFIRTLREQSREGSNAILAKQCAVPNGVENDKTQENSLKLIG